MFNGVKCIMLAMINCVGSYPMFDGDVQKYEKIIKQTAREAEISVYREYGVSNVTACTISSSRRSKVKKLMTVPAYAPSVTDTTL